MNFVKWGLYELETCLVKNGKHNSALGKLLLLEIQYWEQKIFQFSQGKSEIWRDFCA